MKKILAKFLEPDDETEEVESIKPKPDELEPVHSHSWGPDEFHYHGPASRSLILVGDVEQKSTSALISQLLELDASDDSQPIILYINTHGGSATDGFAIYDMLRAISAPVVGVVTGSCMSAGLVILSGCQYRVSTPNSLFFYHQTMMGSVGIQSPHEANSVTSYYNHLQETYDNLVRERCGLSKKKWRKHFQGQTSKYFSPDEALKLGMIDDIMTYTEKSIVLEED